MIRLAHFSDIHITAPRLEWRRQDWFSKRLAAWLNLRCLGRGWRFRHSERILQVLAAELRRRPLDYVVFSGDATALGFESELRRATALLGIEPGDHLPGLAVPGNHDYVTPAVAASGLFERYFASWQQGLRLAGAPYPFAQALGPYWLIGVNSCTGNLWPWDARGGVGAEQLARLRLLLQQLPPGPRILVTHYPVYRAKGRRERPWHHLRDLKDLLAVACEGGICLWLHGHCHDAYYLDLRPQLPFPMVCAGSATQTGQGCYWECTLEGSRCHLLLRRFDPDRGGFYDVQTVLLSLA